MAKILLVEDEKTFRDLLCDVLRRQQHEVTPAANGREALLHAQNQTFDLVITDLIMPEKEGVQTILELREKFKTLRIIAMSGGGRGSAMNYLELARRLGASQTLAKPFALEEFLGAVNKELMGDG